MKTPRTRPMPAWLRDAPGLVRPGDGRLYDALAATAWRRGVIYEPVHCTGLALLIKSYRLYQACGVEGLDRSNETPQRVRHGLDLGHVELNSLKGFGELKYRRGEESDYHLPL